MSFIGKNSLLTGLLCFVSSLLFAQEKSVKLGAGYKSFQHISHEMALHSGKYLYGGFSYQYGNKVRNKIQFQVSNSNREVDLDLTYISAASAINTVYELNFQIFNSKSSSHHLGPYIGNDFNLNFFPKIDNSNFLWENQAFVGISSMNSIALSNSKRVDINFRIPVYSNLIKNRADRFTGESPGYPTQFYSGFANKLFNANIETGYVISKYGVKFGLYYQGEINRTGDVQHRRVTSTAHSLSLRVIY